MSSVVIISKPTMKMLIFISNRVTTKEQNGEFISRDTNDECIRSCKPGDRSLVTGYNSDPFRLMEFEFTLTGPFLNIKKRERLIFMFPKTQITPYKHTQRV